MNLQIKLPKIRPMTASDLDSVMAIADSLAEAPHWGRTAYQRALDPEASPKRISLVAEIANGIVAGFVVGSVLGPQAELELIAVQCDYQRRGLGRQLLREWLASIRQAGEGEVLLELRASNERALKLYSSEGWVEVARRNGYYSDPREDAVLMRLEPIQTHNTQR